jgi:hypothetical protein
MPPLPTPLPGLLVLLRALKLPAFAAYCAELAAKGARSERTGADNLGRADWGLTRDRRDDPLWNSQGGGDNEQWRANGV